MLPLQQAYEVKFSILEYLKATFAFNDKEVNNAFNNFINDGEEGIFKGPYISLKLPFVKADASQVIPLEIKPSFPPYDHQYQSFKRLTTENNHRPESTLITTGTSSGKTECFLYPILDFCHKNQHRKGIKVIILYPMNALATDQAKRLAEAIWSDEKLKGKITAGLFIGEGKDKKKYPKNMGETHVIENRDSIVDSPPDILLTNFKMLDYALMRSNYHNLWNYNFEDSSLLQFLVLDELHTYDGAQGTDVANLIRRLKLKLGIEKGQICPVGTSATIGSGPDSKELLSKYAEKVFGESFDDESIITENRISADDFFESDDEDLIKFIPRTIGLHESRLREDENYSEYIVRQKRLWQLPLSEDPSLLGEELKKLRIVKDIITITCDKIISLNELLRELADQNEEFRKLPEWDDNLSINPREEVINSLLALISEAKVGDSRKFPFLYLQVQIWIRELSGVLREVGPIPKFTWKDKVGDIHEPKALPSYYCRDCGSSGWLGVKDDNKNHFYNEPNQVYDYFFSNHKNVYFINTQDHLPVEEYEATNSINDFISPITLNLQEKVGFGTFQISAVRKLHENKSKHICPECNTENSLGIIGTRIATLSSITVSQVLASNLDPRNDKYRKILAFTNSVQDAAHQAGFIEARNYRFTFRASLQKVLNSLNRTVSLNELQDEFIEYWKLNSDESGANNEEAYYYRFFPADYKSKVDLSQDYRVKGSKKLTESFKKEFDERMRWEISSEFGFNAIIGRTLEKSSASGVKFNVDQLNEAYDLIKDWLSQNNLGQITNEEFVPFLNGVLHRIRIRGGIDNIYLTKFRESGLKLWDLNWMRDNRHFLNKNFSPRTRIPKLVTTVAHSRGVIDTTFTNTNNWFRSYFTKSFKNVSNHNAIVNDFYKELFVVLEKIGCVNSAGSEPNENYALIPSALFVENKVLKLICDCCGSELNVAHSDSISGLSKCINYSCKNGAYIPSNSSKPNYYQLVYNRNRSPRIYAAEHTGILERKDRENKEIDFKERPRFNSLNTIVATSTLEMGIDIGTLSTAMNNSVPPLTSNFLQRVGRAGRSTGSALITNFAQSKAHDLFYFEEPSDMMEGEIATPGCYLEARDILFRHFLAYCIDNWTKANSKENSIPGRLISLRLFNTDLSSQGFLGNRIINYIKSNEKLLLERFVEFYRPDLEDDKVLENLKLYLRDETFYIRFKAFFEQLKLEYIAIHEKRKEIDEIIKNQNLPETDEERKLLEEEKRSLWGLKRILDKRSILEHLTNVGLLPNYAFPETGVTLNAWIKSNKAKASDSIPSDRQFEIVRSSSVAIKEFAPDNYFYSQGFKFEISGLNTFDWKDPGTLIKKRFCSNCDHIADSAHSNESRCPKCGDASWSSAKNQHVFVRLNSVKSVNYRDKSTLDDSKDDREGSHYMISRHIKFDVNSFQGAWGMKDIPFGIEYVKNVDIIEVNLGLSDSRDPNRIDINQISEVPAHGFVTCKYCGKSTSNPGRSRFDSDFKFHFGYCKNKDKEYKGKADEFFEEVFLFKEMKTEALKVLLPVQDLESESQINMFKAGLELGLKKYYKGNPQHLSFLNYSEFNTKNSRFDRYLVIYDNIPGGTGYLEKLFSPVEFTEVIAKAYYSIKECSCQFKGKDGCYRCIFTYSNQYVQEELSRKKAEILFKKILDRSGVWETYTSGLGTLSGNGQIEESELEERFVRSLRNYFLTKEELGWFFEDLTQDSVINYKFKVVNGEYAFYYMMRPQFELGPSEGVKYKTRTDFFISLVDVEFQGNSLSQGSIIESAKGVAVYLDGYTFHATKENSRFYNDLQKRLAIIESGDKISWSLTWSDIERFDIPFNTSDAIDRERRKDFLFLAKSNYKSTFSVYESIPYWSSYKSEIFDAQNSFERLIWYLQNPVIENLSEKIGLFLSLFQKEFGKPSIDEIDISLFLNSPSKKIDTNTIAQSKANGAFYVIPEIGLQDDFISILIAVKLNDLKIQSSIAYREVHENLNKETWEKFWQVFNLIQVSTQTVDEQTQTTYSTQSLDESTDLFECLKYHDTELHDIIRLLIEHDISFNIEGGFFLEKNGTFAEAMLGFEEQKIVIRPLSAEDEKTFIEEGYMIIEPEKFTLDLIKK